MGVGGNRVGRIVGVGVGVGGVCGCGGRRVFGLCGHKRRDLDDIRSVSLRRIRGRLRMAWRIRVRAGRSAFANPGARGPSPPPIPQ